MSVVEHLELLAYAHGGSPQPVPDVLAELGLDGVRDQLPATLSSGERRRLALASCFVRPRRLLVLDEPEQRLDVLGLQWLTERLLQEKAAGTAVLMASHNAELVERVADVVVDLDDAWTTCWQGPAHPSLSPARGSSASDCGACDAVIAREHSPTH
jgi:ABC-type multidrug transport system ATPase subunit